MLKYFEKKCLELFLKLFLKEKMSRENSKVNIILSYLERYRNNNKVINLVAKMYGVLFPPIYEPGINKYLYCLSIFKEYDHLLNRKNIEPLSENLSNFTQYELSFKGIKLYNWPRGLIKYHLLAEHLNLTKGGIKNYPLYRKIEFSSINGEEPDIFEDNLDYYITSNYAEDSIFEALSEWAGNVITFDYEELFIIILKKLTSLYPDKPWYLEDIIKHAISSKYVKYLKYFKKYDITNSLLLSYAKNCHFDENMFEYLVKNYREKMINIAYSLIHTYIIVSNENYLLDEETINNFYIKFKRLILIADKLNLLKCSQLLYTLIKQHKGSEINLQFYIDAYSLIPKNIRKNQK